eukprot:scaffold779_cov205-Alexandrium_tamarense.AAC.22
MPSESPSSIPSTLPSQQPSFSPSGTPTLLPRCVFSVIRVAHIFSLLHPHSHLSPKRSAQGLRSLPVLFRQRHRLNVRVEFHLRSLLDYQASVRGEFSAQNHILYSLK